jgi:acyl-CoA thioesterase I
MIGRATRFSMRWLVLAVGVSSTMLQASAVLAQTHVTCVGDSITAGNGTSSPSAAYPAVLQTLLGSAFAVENDGHSGATMLNGGDLPYSSVAEYGTSTAWSANGGDVVIQLGTNDSKPVNWSKKASFLGDCEALVGHYLAAAGKPRVWVNLIPPATAKACCSIDGAIIEKEIVPLLATCATQTGAATIDVFGALTNHTNTLADGVHPDDEGAAIIARVVRDALARVPTIGLSASPDPVTEPAAIVLTATPSAAYGTVERVEVFEDQVLRGEKSSSPWVITLEGVAAGAHVYSARVTETRGRTGTSQPITVNVIARVVDPPPSSGSSDAGIDGADGSFARGDPPAEPTASGAGATGGASASPGTGESGDVSASGGVSTSEPPDGSPDPRSDEPAAATCHAGGSSRLLLMPTSLLTLALVFWLGRRGARRSRRRAG